MKKKLLIFHPTIAPYRIDFFNDLFEAFDTRVCLMYRNLKSQKFEYSKIEELFNFKPLYLKRLCKVGRKEIYGGHIKQLNNFKPDVVIVSAYNIDALLVYLYKFLLRKKYKIIAICDDSYNMVAEGNDFSWIHKIARTLLAPKMDELILIEPKSVDWHQQQYGKGIFFPIIKDDARARREYESLLLMSKVTLRMYGLQGKKVLLFVGRLVEIKNVQTAIRAFVQLNQDENVFVIVGDGPERCSLEQLAQELNANVIFTGRLEGDELNQWYNIATCFILPSYQEPFGAVTNEALLAGCWGLISNKAGSRCLIEDGKNGYTFDPMNVDEIAKKIQKSFDELESIKEMKLKANRMLVSYRDCMNELINHLNGIYK